MGSINFITHKCRCCSIIYIWEEQKERKTATGLSLHVKLVVRQKSLMIEAESIAAESATILDAAGLMCVLGVMLDSKIKGAEFTAHEVAPLAIDHESADINYRKSIEKKLATLTAEKSQAVGRAALLHGRRRSVKSPSMSSGEKQFLEETIIPALCVVRKAGDCKQTISKAG